MRVLFISYWYEPDPSVAARRVSYWAENWKKVRPLDRVTVISATPLSAKPETLDHYIHLPSFPLKRNSRIQDVGVGWKEAIQDYFHHVHHHAFDLVVMTGGPFMHFGLASYFKTKWKCKVVLDFRDPFARNPRFDNSALKIAVKRIFERRFLRLADGVVVVNSHCLDLVRGARKMPHRIIPNGFDERDFQKVEHPQHEGLRIIHAGKFYSTSWPHPLLERLNENVKLTHIGPAQPEFEQQGKTTQVEFIPPQPYVKVRELLPNFDAGLVLVTKPFESTTKVYDYIGSGLPLVVLSNFEPWTGTLAQELASIEDHVIWERCDSQGAQQAVERISSGLSPIPMERRQEFSRRKGLDSLVHWVESQIMKE